MLVDNLVVLIHFSKATNKALAYATALVQQYQVKIQLVHFWELSNLDANFFVAVPVTSAYFDKISVSSRKEHDVGSVYSRWGLER